MVMFSQLVARQLHSTLLVLSSQVHQHTNDLTQEAFLLATNANTEDVERLVLL
jgi:hypothetical protein